MRFIMSQGHVLTGPALRPPPFRVYYDGMDSAHPEAHGEIGPSFSPGEKRDPTLRLRSTLRADDLIGHSPPMIELLRQLSLLAPSTSRSCSPAPRARARPTSPA
ncbi:hypothetical protein [Nannocystis pusilla]|uniref:hypothetical protein n=1 Tax=Nannocystis pusilla TaxID=889268 RepID=UPI003B7FBD5F